MFFKRGGRYSNLNCKKEKGPWKVIYIYTNVYGYTLGRKIQPFFSVRKMAQSLVKDEAFDAGDGWIKVPVRKETNFPVICPIIPAFRGCRENDLLIYDFFS